MTEFRKLLTTTLLLLYIGLFNIVSANNSESQEVDSPGFQVIGSLIALGIIAFIAPFLRRDKTENQ